VQEGTSHAPMARVLRIADGADDVHCGVVARIELRRSSRRFHDTGPTEGSPTRGCRPAAGWTTVRRVGELSGKVYIVTGANTGIGRVAASEIAKKGATWSSPVDRRRRRSRCSTRS
jgi:hypothetical protein